MRYIDEPARKTKVVEEVDLCVLGGSCTGLFAAVRAAQLGLRTAIIEKQNCFGGMATAGLVNIWHSLYDTAGKQQIIGGLTEQLIHTLARRNAATINPMSPSSANTLNTEELKIELDLLVRENHITPYLHSFFCGASTAEGQITHVIIENKNGRGAIRAKFFIDATGDGDLCRLLDIPSYTYENQMLQPPSLCAKIAGTAKLQPVIGSLLKEHGGEFGLEEDWGWRKAIPNAPNVLMHAETHVFGHNLADANSLTYAEMEGRLQVRAVLDTLRKYAENGESLTLLSLASAIGIRETYHIRSHHQITGAELLGGTRYEDAIGNSSYRVDTHHSEGAGITFCYLDGTRHTISHSADSGTWDRWREETAENPTFYQIPYRALVPQGGFSNLLCCGRMIDADQKAYSALRVMVNTNQMGEAAGAAAALALQSGKPASAVDTNRLRSTLGSLGALIL